MNWQPIDTAPKDSSRFLTFHPVRGTRIATWDDDRYSNKPRPYFASASFGSNRVGDDRRAQPTHWMPLPPPPGPLPCERCGGSGLLASLEEPGGFDQCHRCEATGNQPAIQPP